ncbi:MAG TPA: acyl-CoA dehydrogenase family protein [Candidatus Acidoferrales bacterium]|nr:acyl-CoA dehydrogenase family protein [Candidatus Acidoferrales bacterium]
MADIKTILAGNEKLSNEMLRSNADQIDQARRFPRENLHALAKAGVLGLLIPTQYGGAGGGLAEMSQVLDTQAQNCASTAMVTLMHYCATVVIAAKGSDALKQQVLPACARGENISTLAFSEAGSGGHFYMPVSEVRESGGRKTLSATKSFVTSAGEANSYVVSARKAGATAPTETNLYVIAKDAPGFSTQGRFEGLGLAGNASAPMSLKDVAIDDAARLGAEGSGFQSMLEVVLPNFQVGVASVSVGLAKAAHQAIVARMGARKYEHAGGAALASIPRVQFLVAEITLAVNSGQAFLRETIRKALAADPAAMLDVLGVKVAAADACLAAVSRAMTLGGGWAFGKRGGLERIFRDAQAAAVMAPPSDVLKDFIGKASLGLPLF